MGFFNNDNAAKIKAEGVKEAAKLKAKAMEKQANATIDAAKLTVGAMEKQVYPSYMIGIGTLLSVGVVFVVTARFQGAKNRYIEARDIANNDIFSIR